jgi:hypothetical protein
MQAAHSAAIEVGVLAHAVRCRSSHDIGQRIGVKHVVMFVDVLAEIDRAVARDPARE